MQVILEFFPNLGIFAYCFSSFLRVLLECRSYLRAGLFRGFTVFTMTIEKLGLFGRFISHLYVNRSRPWILRSWPLIESFMNLPMIALLVIGFKQNILISFCILKFLTVCIRKIQSKIDSNRSQGIFISLK